MLTKLSAVKFAQAKNNSVIMAPHSPQSNLSLKQLENDTVSFSGRVKSKSCFGDGSIIDSLISRVDARALREQKVLLADPHFTGVLEEAKTSGGTLKTEFVDGVKIRKTSTRADGTTHSTTEIDPKTGAERQTFYREDGQTPTNTPLTEEEKREAQARTQKILDKVLKV